MSAAETDMVDRPGRRIDAKDFPEVVRAGDFSNCRIEWCRGKNVVFIDCNFSSALIRHCYFHRASFEGCNFIGSSIVESNMRGAKFTRCSFEYSTFRSTTIDAQTLLRNLPSWENARRELLRSLRKNAESVGDIEDVRVFLAAEMEASEEHWRSAFRQVDGYYVHHYPGWIRGRLIPLARMIGVRSGRLFWGHGDSPFKLLISLTLWLSVAALLLDWPDSPRDYFRSMKDVFAVILGVRIQDVAVPEWLVLILAASRYLFLSLFAAVFVRRFARR